MYNQNIIDVNSKEAPFLSLNNTKLSFAFGLTIDSFVNNNSSLFNYITFSSQYITKYPNATKKRENLNITNCEKYHFDNKINDSFDEFLLNNYQCIDPNNNSNNLSLEGIFTDSVFKYIELSAIIKEDALNETEFLKSFLLDHEVKLHLFYLDSSINVSNYHTPEKLYLNNQYLRLSFPFINKVNADFSNNTFEEDKNILVSSEKEFYFYTLQTYDVSSIYLGETRLIDRKKDYALLGRIYIRASQSSVIYKRTYQKITEYLADSTTIVSQVLFLLVLVIGEYNQFKAKEYIIDNMLNYKKKFMKKNPESYYLLKRLFNSKPQEAVDTKNNISFNALITKSELVSSVVNNSLKRNDTALDCYDKKIPSFGDKKTSEQSDFVQTVCNQSKSLIPEKKIKTNNFLIHQPTITKEIENFKDFQKKTQLKEDIIQSTLSKPENSYPIYYNYLPPQIKNKTKINEQMNNKQNYQDKSSEETLTHSFIEMGKLVFSKCGYCKKDKNFVNKEMMFEKGLERYYYYLSIFSYFTKMREIEILKYVLLSQNQKVLVDFVSKPSISLLINDKESPLSPSLDAFDNSADRMNTLHYSFIRCNNEFYRNKNENQQKLLQLASYELFQLI